MFFCSAKVSHFAAHRRDSQAAVHSLESRSLTSQANQPMEYLRRPPETREVAAGRKPDDDQAARDPRNDR
jgi:hypothetical protein